MIPVARIAAPWWRRLWLRLTGRRICDRCPACDRPTVVGFVQLHGVARADKGWRFGQVCDGHWPVPCAYGWDHGPNSPIAARERLGGRIQNRAQHAQHVDRGRPAPTDLPGPGESRLG